MRKLLSLVAALAITSSTATSLVACGEDNTAYDNFMKHMNANESFVYFLGAKDCPYCQTTLKTGWKDVQDKSIWNSYTSGIEYGDSYHASYVFSSFTDANVKKGYVDSYNNMHFYNYEVDNKGDIFKDDGVSKLVNYIIKLVAESAKIDDQEFKGWTAADLGLTEIPLYIYVNHGHYAGFDTGSRDTAGDVMNSIRTHMNPGYVPPIPGSNPAS